MFTAFSATRWLPVWQVVMTPWPALALDVVPFAVAGESWVWPPLLVRLGAELVQR